MKLCPLTANRNWLPKSQWQNLHKLLQTHCQVWDSFGCEMPFEFGKSDSWGWIHFKQHANCVGDSDFWKILPCEKNRRITLTLSTTSNFMCIANIRKRQYSMRGSHWFSIESIYYYFLVVALVLLLVESLGPQCNQTSRLQFNTFRLRKTLINNTFSWITNVSTHDVCVA